VTTDCAAAPSDDANSAARLPVWLPLAILCGTMVLAYTGLPGIPCLFRETTGLPCAGCGLTRSLKSLWSLDLVSSIRFHPLGIVLFSACGTYLASRLMKFNLPPVTRRVWIVVLFLS
jgi:hypothetical protein